MLKGLMVDSYMYNRQTYCVHRRSYISAHILLNLLNKQGGKVIKCKAHRGLAVEFLLLRFSVFLSLLYLLFILRFICSRR